MMSSKIENRIFVWTAISTAVVTVSILAVYYSLMYFAEFPDKMPVMALAIIALAAISISIASTALSISRIKHMLRDTVDDIAGDVSTASMLITACASVLFAYGVMASNIVDAITSVAAGAAMLSLYYLLVVALIRTANRRRGREGGSTV